MTLHRVVAAVGIVVSALWGSAEGAPAKAADLLPTVTIDATDPAATEAGPTPGSVTVTRTGATLLPLTVSYSVGGSATNGVDYASLSGSVTIPIGSASAAIDIYPIDDTAVEGDETVTLTIQADLTYVVGSPGSATVTIVDDDAAQVPTVKVQATDPTATEAGPTSGAITVSRTGGTGSSLTVSYSVGGSATNGVDYASLSGSVTIPIGSASAAIDIDPIDDTAAEGDETVVIAILPDAAYTIGSPSSATVTIEDDDAAGRLPDLVIRKLTGPSAGLIGGTIQISVSVSNVGAAKAGSFLVGIYYSSDATITTTDLPSGFTCDVSGLGAGSTTKCAGPIRVDPSVSPGTYDLGAIADDRSVVVEGNENNNARSADSGPIDLVATGLVVTSPVQGDPVDCRAGGQAPTIVWDPGRYDRFKVFLSTKSTFPDARTTSSGKVPLSITSWTVPAGKWKALCRGSANGGALFVTVMGIDTGVRSTDPFRKSFAPVVAAEVMK